MHNPPSLRHLVVRWFDVTGDRGPSSIPLPPCTLSALSSGVCLCAREPLSYQGSNWPLHHVDYHNFGSVRTSFGPCSLPAQQTILSGSGREMKARRHPPFGYRDGADEVMYESRDRELGRTRHHPSDQMFALLG